MQDVDLAIKMLRDLAARGLKAVNIPAFPMAKVDKAGATGFANNGEWPNWYEGNEFRAARDASAASRAAE